MIVYGYARVSTERQSLNAEIDQLRAAGCERIVTEKESGANVDRPKFKRLLRSLRPGDRVLVTALDRLTRGGPLHMLGTLDNIISKGATYKSLAEPWANTTDELGEVLASLVGYIARKTRQDIVRRTSEGRRRAVAAGVKLGRKPKLSAEQREDALARRRGGEALRLIAKSYGVSPSTISRLRPVKRDSGMQENGELGDIIRKEPEAG
jgi:DNA invertase Pin-like site-specific DNA recombinase